MLLFVDFRVRCENVWRDICEECPIYKGKDNGITWCHGDCEWKDDKCTGEIEEVGIIGT